jgi:membrane-associated phospholipid phosphatase
MRYVWNNWRRRNEARRNTGRTVAACCTSLVLLVSAHAQSGSGMAAIHAATPALSALPDAPAPQTHDTGAVTVRNSPRHVLEDQKAIWTSPAHIRKHDLVWLLPVAAATGVALATDSHAMRSVVSRNPEFNHNNVDAANSALTLLFAVPVVNLAYGELGNHAHARETGILGAETVVDAAILEQGMKLAFWRERPHVDDSNGKFWQSSVGADSSFPSSHAVFAWATAAEIAGEYPSRWSQLSVYSLATTVSLTRVLGQEHFPSDVLVGSTVGWLAGHYVYKVRHRWHQHHDQ